ncbi:acyl-CoA dehydrogenase family protein [Streptomyces sp. N50]|uniref:acyl-CoA dehydrogenase family protein n=1 Tax=Streptomyces sp. N50 TaxID=3081765 RepID=UPI002961FB72|nr:acyl-CoA dehydrogenase family protein [Streptomyces sp. N50]WOX15003.1 acyl-CoA dehydrogenase family protein [Streptomyces sp. N50]
MKVERELLSGEARELLELTVDIADKELAPRAAEFEEEGRFPREVFGVLGEAGLLTLPFGEDVGGGGQPYAVYLQVLEELAARWAAVAVGVSVHTLSCHPVSVFGSAAQREALLPWQLSGAALGAYCLSEEHAGSDPSAIRAGAARDGEAWAARGTKAWVTHGGEADFYTAFLRTCPDPRDGISCFHVDARSPGLSAGAPERKMGLRSSTTALMHFDDVRIPGDRLIGEPGQGLKIALSALDAGRLGIAAVAVGIAQAALNHAVDYARERRTFGRLIIEHQGVGFLLADMAARTEAARATYLVAARRKDCGQEFSRQASIAKLIATDTAMAVTTDAVQVLGGAGYVREHPVERYMREAKITQIFEGTNQIQRMVISRRLADS